MLRCLKMPVRMVPDTNLTPVKVEIHRHKPYAILRDESSYQICPQDPILLDSHKCVFKNKIHSSLTSL